MKKTNIGVIFGGKSTEYDVSLRSAKNILEALDREKYRVYLYAFSNEGQLLDFESSLQLITAGEKEPLEAENQLIGVELGHLLSAGENESDQIDVFFPVMHGNLGEDGSIQGMFRMLNKPFVGSSVLSSALCMDKDLSKQVLNYNGFATAKSITVKKQDKIEELYQKVKITLGSNVFIKPANQGSSVGVSKVGTEAAFYSGLESAFKFDNKVIIEEQIIGKEIECAVLGNQKPQASALGSIVTEKDAFYSYEAKYIDENGAQLEIPASVSSEMAEKIQQIAVAAYQTLECRGMARVDFFLTDDEEIILNEINTIPGFTNISMYAKLWEVSGVPYERLVEQLIELAQEEYRNEAELQRKWQ